MPSNYLIASSLLVALCAGTCNAFVVTPMSRTARTNSALMAQSEAAIAITKKMMLEAGETVPAQGVGISASSDSVEAVVNTVTSTAAEAANTAADAVVTTESAASSVSSSLDFSLDLPPELLAGVAIVAVGAIAISAMSGSDDSKEEDAAKVVEPVAEKVAVEDKTEESVTAETYDPATTMIAEEDKVKSEEPESVSTTAEVEIPDASEDAEVAEEPKVEETMQTKEETS